MRNAFFALLSVVLLGVSNASAQKVLMEVPKGFGQPVAGSATGRLDRPMHVLETLIANDTPPQLPRAPHQP